MFSLPLTVFLLVAVGALVKPPAGPIVREVHSRLEKGFRTGNIKAALLAYGPGSTAFISFAGKKINVIGAAEVGEVLKKLRARGYDGLAFQESSQTHEASGWIYGTGKVILSSPKGKHAGNYTLILEEDKSVWIINMQKIVF